MTAPALTVEQVIERVIADYKEHYDFPPQGESHMRDRLADALSERGGEPIGWLDWPGMQFRPNGHFEWFPVSVKGEPIPLFTRPQAGQGKLPGFIKPDTDTHVYFYEQDHYYLSNFSAFQVNFDGTTFNTSEEAYHYQRFAGNAECRRAILWAKSAHEAFRYAQENKRYQIPEWDQVKVDIMRDILRAKVAQHEYVHRKLLQTGNKELIEDSHRDPYWGWGPNADGLNMLGKLWMEVRSELLSAQGGSHG